MLMQTPTRIKRSIVFLTLLAGLATLVLGASPERRVLVYTKNQVAKGLYVHDNIPASVAAIKKLGEENNFGVDVSDDPAVFTDQNLKRYKALIFDNTNNEIFDNIPASVAAIKKLGEENNFGVDVSDDPAVFTDQNLKRYKALIFDNTNN